MRTTIVLAVVVALTVACKLSTGSVPLAEVGETPVEEEPGYGLWGYADEMAPVVAADHVELAEDETHPGDLLEEEAALLRLTDEPVEETAEGTLTASDLEEDAPGVEFATDDDLGFENGFQPRLAEGDMVLDVEEDEASDAPQGLSLANRAKRLWPGGRIIYAFDAAFPQDKTSLVLGAMREWEQGTGVTFVARTSETGYVNIQSKKKGCFATVGYTGARQLLNLGARCFSHDTALHELGHAVGLWHEQSRSDVADHLTIVRENVVPLHLHNFNRKGEAVGAYDYDSIMHYSAKAFSKNNKATMVPKKAGVRIGVATHLSAGDIAAVSGMYGTGGGTGGSCSGAYGLKWNAKFAKTSAGQCRNPKSHCSCWKAKGGTCKLFTPDSGSGKVTSLSQSVSPDGSGACYNVCDKLVKSATSAVQNQCDGRILMANPQKQLEVWRYKR